MGEGLGIQNVVSVQRMEDTDAIQDTLYSEHMRRATYLDGSRAYITWYRSRPGIDDSGGDPTYAERSVAAERFFRSVGLDAMVPEHYYHVDGARYLAVEEIDGDEVAKEHKPGEWDISLADDPDAFIDDVDALHLARISPEYAAEVDRDTYLRFAGATILSGNSDMKGENLIIPDNGVPVGIDLDHAGGDFTQHYETNEPWDESHYERGIRYLTTVADVLDLSPAVTREDIEEETQEFAQQIEEIYDLDELEAILPDSEFLDSPPFQYSTNIRKNIESFSDGDFPPVRRQ